MMHSLNINKINKSFTRQHSQFYCGLACLASVVKYHGGETTQEKLREESGTTLNGTSLLGLYQAAQKMGFGVAGYEAGIENLKELTEPVILHVLKDKTLEHFVVCYGFEKSKFILGDPASGIEYYMEEELAAVWKSKALLKLTPGKNFVTRKNGSKNKRTWFLQLLKPDYPVLGIAAFLGIVISVLGLATAIFSQKLIDHILPEKNTRTLVLGLIIFAVILFARAVVMYIRTIFMVRQSREMNVRLISYFFGKLLFLPKPFFDSTSTGDMVARMNDAKAWRNHVAVVEQHVQLFYGTVLENISLQEKPDIEQVVTFCQKYGFHDYIMEFQQGYATIIHENSTNLSGGQRQLIALARAVYSQPQLLLLDEATAAMGRRTEKFVIELLHNLKKEIPVVFVTHRPQLTYYADRIYVIENKTVSAFGIHTDLIKSNFFYRAAFEEQLLC